MGNLIYLLIPLVFSILGNIALVVLLTDRHYREKKDIFNRFMAADYRVYNYHEKVQPVEIENWKKKLENADGTGVSEEQREKLRRAAEY